MDPAELRQPNPTCAPVVLAPITIHLEESTRALVKRLQARGGHRTLAAMVETGLTWINALQELRKLGYTEVQVVRPGTGEAVKLIRGKGWERCE